MAPGSLGAKGAASDATSVAKKAASSAFFSGAGSGLMLRKEGTVKSHHAQKPSTRMLKSKSTKGMRS